MKRSLLLISAVAASFSGFAQRVTTVHALSVNPVDNAAYHTPASGRTTAVGDTFTLSNIATGSALTAYTYGAGNGYVTGTNVNNDLGFAERYDFNSADSSVRVMGVLTRFTGIVNASSVNSVNFHVWDQTVPVPVTATLAYSGFPNSIIDTVTVPFTQLGIGTVSDTAKAFYFDSATAPLNQPFFIGYDLSYNFTTLAGDTIGLMSSLNGARTSDKYTTSVFVNDFGDTTRDTVINVQNATEWSDFTWHDNYTDNDSIFNDLAIYPIVAINAPTSVNGVTRKNLTVFGAYPNPAVNATNIKFSLAASADVTVELLDTKGRTLQSAKYKAMAQGEHIIPTATDKLSPGNYLLFIRTSSGDGLAAQLTIIK